MKKALFRYLLMGCLCATAALLSGCCTTREASPEAGFNEVCARIVQAIEANKEQDFQAEFDPSSRELLPFGQLQAAVAGRLSEGYRLHYLGQLQVADQTLALWKLKFTGGGDDMLVKIFFHEGRPISFKLEP